jgi:hypothetical protein
VERLAATMHPKPRVVSLNPLSLDDVLGNVLSLGAAVGLEASAAAAHAGLLARIAKVDAAVATQQQQQEEEEQKGRLPHPRPSVAFIEWPDPIYVGGHWTPQLIERAGGSHPLNPWSPTHGGTKSFPVEDAAVAASQPDVVIVCPCGLSLAHATAEARNLAARGAGTWWPRLPAARAGQVFAVDGDAMFNRPGPRLVDALEWLASILLVDKGACAAPAGFPAERLRSLRPAALSPPAAAHATTQAAPAADAPAAAAAAAANTAAAAPCTEGGLSDIEDLATAAARAKHCAIVEAHACAVAGGLLQYKDPDSGYGVFTQVGMQRPGVGCFLNSF